MTSRLNPYLNFNGNARQALEFYNSVFGGTLTLSTFAEFGQPQGYDADRSSWPAGDRRRLHADGRRRPGDMGYQPAAGSGSAGPATTPSCATTVRSSPPADRHDATGEAGLGRRVRHVR